MTKEELKQSIADMRGGIPPKCDFCKEDMSPDEMEPEEGGLWACCYCLLKWKLDGTLGY